MDDAENPLVQALPPATDYLTYLTLLEYQLTPERLPLLHRLLQDEKLTVNIGWDLVKLLLPMLPRSTECLQDVARLGNPREVILRVSEALMDLHPQEEDDDEEAEENQALPKHVLQFNCLVSMLSILHTRIQTKSPSRFIATSLQAVLEAYSSMVTDETTLSFLEFIREVSPRKRPAPPPRTSSQSAVLRISEPSAPDPEAESTSPSPNADGETQLVNRFLQFGLVELLKAYRLDFASDIDPGMAYAIRMLEYYFPNKKVPGRSLTEAFAADAKLKERDLVMGKIRALSRDLGIDNNELISIIKTDPEDDETMPLDFDDPPKSIDAIALERHGALLLLAARVAGEALFSSGPPVPQISAEKDLLTILANFPILEPDHAAEPQEIPVKDSLLVLAAREIQQPVIVPSDTKDFNAIFERLVLLTAFGQWSIVRQIPASILSAHTSDIVRFEALQTLHTDSRILTSVADTALGLLKEELLKIGDKSIFHDPVYFWTLWSMLIRDHVVSIVRSPLERRVPEIYRRCAPVISALNLYYVLLSSPIREKAEADKTLKIFRDGVQNPLKKALDEVMSQDASTAGFYEEMLSAIKGGIELILSTLERIQQATENLRDEELKDWSEEEKVKIAEIYPGPLWS